MRSGCWVAATAKKKLLSQKEGLSITVDRPCGATSKRPHCVSHATWPALVQSLAVVLVLDASTLLRIMRKSRRIWSFLALLVLDVVRGSLLISEDHGDALQAVGFSGAVGAGRGEDALGSHVIEFENSLVAAAEVTCVVLAQTEILDNSSAFHAETVHCLSPCQ